MSDLSASVRDGGRSGIVAGLAFAVAQVVATVIAGEPAVLAARRFASVLLGPDALSATPAATVIAIGLASHLYLSAMYGLCYGVSNAALAAPGQRVLARQAIIGPLYGAALWLVNVRLFARVRYPWLVALPESQLVLHVVCFGLPLGLSCAAIERGSARLAPAAAAALPVAIASRVRAIARQRRCASSRDAGGRIVPPAAAENC